jgi:hypothetical protein
MEALGGMYEMWGSMGNPAMYFMIGMIVLPSLVAYIIGQNELKKKDKKYK